MTTLILNRRNLLAGGGSVLATGISGLLSPASAIPSRLRQPLGITPPWPVNLFRNVKTIIGA